jgi:hypothetical protein
MALVALFLVSGAVILGKDQAQEMTIHFVPLLGSSAGFTYVIAKGPIM